MLDGTIEKVSIGDGKAYLSIFCFVGGHLTRQFFTVDKPPIGFEACEGMKVELGAYEVRINGKTWAERRDNVLRLKNKER